MFLNSPRYTSSPTPLSSSSTRYGADTVASLKSFVLEKTGLAIKVREPKQASRPRGYWTIKQKSMLLSDPPVVKVRPIISHSRHPCRAILKRVGRALSVLVCLASQAVQETNRLHVPMWKLHEGSRQWIERLRDRPQTAEIVEFDVEDCFLNTPRSLVTRAHSFWVSFSFGRRRRVQFISISKDSHKEDHVGRPCSSHFWELSVPTICAVVEWEMEHNAEFEVASCAGTDVVLRQVKGLPIGCHLSAALVELTALFFRANDGETIPP